MLNEIRKEYVRENNMLNKKNWRDEIEREGNQLQYRKKIAAAQNE